MKEQLKLFSLFVFICVYFWLVVLLTVSLFMCVIHRQINVLSLIKSKTHLQQTIYWNYNKYNEKKFTDSLIFNESEYYYLYNNPYSWNIAKQLHDFKFNVCIFIGISLTDPDMKRLLELAQNYLKFNFIFLKKEKDFSETVYRDLTSYFFTFDLIVIWIDEYSQIADYLENL